MPKKKTSEAAPEVINFPDYYTVLGADLSLTRPGLALLEVDKKNGAVEIRSVKLTSVNNKGKTSRKSHGQILYEIQKEFFHFLNGQIPDFFVREHEIMNKKVPSERSVTKVVGLMDILAYEMERKWYEIYPVTVKALVGGSGKAEKSQVAAGLPFYIGERKYRNDDESDAAAVAIGWLIQHDQLEKRNEKDIRVPD